MIEQQEEDTMMSPELVSHVHGINQSINRIPPTYLPVSSQCPNALKADVSISQCRSSRCLVIVYYWEIIILWSHLYHESKKASVRSNKERQEKAEEASKAKTMRFMMWRYSSTKFGLHNFIPPTVINTRVRHNVPVIFTKKASDHLDLL